MIDIVKQPAITQQQILEIMREDPRNQGRDHVQTVLKPMLIGIP